MSLKNYLKYSRFYCHTCSFHVQNVTKRIFPLNIGYITVETPGHQRRSPIQGSVFSASSVANICKYKGAHSTNNICTKYRIVHKALVGSIIFSFFLKLYFFKLQYLFFGSFAN